MAAGWRHVSVDLGDLETAEDAERWEAVGRLLDRLLDGHRHRRVGTSDSISVAVAPPGAAEVVAAIEDAARALGAFGVRHTAV